MHGALVSDLTCSLLTHPLKSNRLPVLSIQMLTLDTLLPKNQWLPVASRERVEMCPEARKVLGEAEGNDGD